MEDVFMSFIRKLIFLVVIYIFTFPMAHAQEKIKQSTVITSDKLTWGYLNPLRGDQSPGAANLWGDRNKDISTGMLVKFKKGFSSPPHIHNISYRGVVIEGEVHNDDPLAEKMWMPKGSFWTQPAGENHITAANAKNNLIYLEIDGGPYLVKPASEHFDSGEKPINIHSSNLVWLNADNLVNLKASNIELATLWGNLKAGKPGGVLIKFPADFSGTLDVNATEFRAVIIDGRISYRSKENPSSKNLASASYFSSKGEFEHNIKTSVETIIYVRVNGHFLISPE